MAFDHDRIPATAQSLIPLAEQWGIGDDYEREAAVSDASDDDLRSLITAVDEVADDFWAWLAGPESYAQPPSIEYVMMTALTMAADSARLELAGRRDSGAR